MLLIIFKVHSKCNDLMLATSRGKAMISKPSFFLFRIKALNITTFTYNRIIDQALKKIQSTICLLNIELCGIQLNHFLQLTSSDVTQVCYCGYIQMVAIAKGENSRKHLSLVWGFGSIDQGISVIPCVAFLSMQCLQRSATSLEGQLGLLKIPCSSFKYLGTLISFKK